MPPEAVRVHRVVAKDRLAVKPAEHPHPARWVGGRYAVGHAQSRSLGGPYRKSPRPILESVEGATYGPGHQTVINTPAGEWWMMYHAWDAVVIGRWPCFLSPHVVSPCSMKMLFMSKNMLRHTI